MHITYDPKKRELTLNNRGLDFEDASRVFSGFHTTGPDLRKDYGEERLITIGQLDDEVVVLVWTERNESRRIISMRKANENERKTYQRELDRPG